MRDNSQQLAGQSAELDLSRIPRGEVNEHKNGPASICEWIGGCCRRVAFGWGTWEGEGMGWRRRGTTPYWGA